MIAYRVYCEEEDEEGRKEHVATPVAAAAVLEGEEGGREEGHWSPPLSLSLTARPASFFLSRWAAAADATYGDRSRPSRGKRTCV